MQLLATTIFSVSTYTEALGLAWRDIGGSRMALNLQTNDLLEIEYKLASPSESGEFRFKFQQFWSGTPGAIGYGIGRELMLPGQISFTEKLWVDASTNQLAISLEIKDCIFGPGQIIVRQYR